MSASEATEYGHANIDGDRTFTAPIHTIHTEPRVPYLDAYERFEREMNTKGGNPFSQTNPMRRREIHDLVMGHVATDIGFHPTVMRDHHATTQAFRRVRRTYEEWKADIISAFIARVGVRNAFSPAPRR